LSIGSGFICNDHNDGNPLSLTAGHRIPGVNYTRDHSSGCLHQLMLAHIDDKSRLDDTMKWQGKGCYGYVVQRTDRKLSLIAQKVYGDPDRWREIAELERHHEEQPLPEWRLPEGVRRGMVRKCSLFPDRTIRFFVFSRMAGRTPHPIR